MVYNLQEDLHKSANIRCIRIIRVAILTNSQTQLHPGKRCI